MLTPQIDVVRAVAPKVLLRVDDAVAAVDEPAGMPTMVLRFSPFNTWYEIDSLWEGTFLERTVKGAFKRTIKEDRDSMRVLYDHGFDGQIGNKVLGAIDDVREDDDGPVAEVPLFDTSYNRDLLPGLEAGVYGSSFRFQVRKEQWNDDPEPSDYNPKGLPERTLLDVKAPEFGPVTFPASRSATAGTRSMTDEYYEQLARRDQQAFDAAVRCVQRTTPDFTGQPGARSAGGGETGAEGRSPDASRKARRARELAWRLRTRL